MPISLRTNNANFPYLVKIWRPVQRKQCCIFARRDGNLLIGIENTHEPMMMIPPALLNPHRPTKILVEPAACKSLKINKVASRALASLLITEREICGNRAGNRAAAEATRATSLRFSLGEQAKKIPTDKSWDFEYWWWNTEPNPRPFSEADSNRTRKCPCFRAFVLFES